MTIISTVIWYFLGNHSTIKKGKEFRDINWKKKESNNIFLESTKESTAKLFEIMRIEWGG